MFKVSGAENAANKTFIDELNLAIVGTKNAYTQ